jgi:energy-coupling factor transporter ATP-binding protein EcfA2
MVLVYINEELKRKYPQGLYFDGKYHENVMILKNLVLDKKHQATIIIDGPSGAGKTTLGTQTALLLDPTFNLSRVVFDPDSFFQALQAAEPGQAVVFDESMILNSRNAMSAWNKRVNIILSQIRSKQLFIIFILPAVFDLDRSITLFKADCLIHCYLRKYKRGFFTVYSRKKIKELYLLGKKFYTYDKPTANFFGRFGSKFLLDEEAYENKKQEAINVGVNGKKKDEGLKKWKEQRNRLLKELYLERRMGLKEISALFPTNMALSPTEICDICHDKR